MQSASATSSFSSPLRSRPNMMATVSPEAMRGAISAAACAGPMTGLAWSWARAVVARTKLQSAMRGRQRVVEHGVVEDPAGAGRHDTGLLVWPALPWFDEPQARQAEIRHGARGSADILAELRLDQDDHRSWRRAPALGLVGAGARHAVLLGGQMPQRSAPAQAGRLRQAWQRTSRIRVDGPLSRSLGQGFYQRSADAIGRAPNSRQSNSRLAMSAPRTIHLRARGKDHSTAPANVQFPVGPNEPRPEVQACQISKSCGQKSMKPRRSRPIPSCRSSKPSSARRVFR